MSSCLAAAARGGASPAACQRALAPPRPPPREGVRGAVQGPRGRVRGGGGMVVLLVKEWEGFCVHVEFTGMQLYLGTPLICFFFVVFFFNYYL